MEVNFVFWFIITGIVSLCIPRRRLFFWWPLLSFATIGYGLFQLFTTESGLDVIWNATPNLKVNLSFIPWQAGRFGAAGIILLSALAAYYTLFDVGEKYKNKLIGLIMINCIFVLSAFCSANYIQLLASVGLADVVIYGIINQIDAKRRYIYGNVLADFMLLCIISVILGQQGNISILGIEKYTRGWRHRDFIAIMLLSCIFIKSGIAFFHIAYQKMVGLSFNRLNFILFASTPLLGFIILYLLQDILLISGYSLPLLKFFALTSVLWGGLGAMVADSIKRKAVYMSMLFWGLSFTGFVWLPFFSGLAFFSWLIAAFLFNCSLMLFYKTAFSQLYVSQMGEIIKTNRTALMICVASLYAYGGFWWLFAHENIILAGSGLAFLMIVSAHIFAEICLASPQIRPIRPLKTRKPSLFLAIPILLAVIALELENEQWPLFDVYGLGIMMVWWSLFVCRPLQKIDFLYKVKFVQQNDLLAGLYHLLILMPIQLLGRLLRLVVEFIFIERTIIVSLKNAVRLFIFVFHRFNRGWGKVFFVLLAIFVVILAYINGVAR